MASEDGGGISRGSEHGDDFCPDGSLMRDTDWAFGGNLGWVSGFRAPTEMSSRESSLALSSRVSRTSVLSEVMGGDRFEVLVLTVWSGEEDRSMVGDEGMAGHLVSGSV